MIINNLYGTNNFITFSFINFINDDMNDFTKEMIVAAFFIVVVSGILIAFLKPLEDAILVDKNYYHTEPPTSSR
jgi:hypothetical protein